MYQDEGTASSRNIKYVLGGVESSIWAHAADLLPDWLLQIATWPHNDLTQSWLRYWPTQYFWPNELPIDHSLHRHQIINTKSFVGHYQSDFSSLQVHCYFNFNMSRASSAFQLLQSMPRCYEVPPTLWRPNSFFRVWWAPYGPTLAPTHQTPVNTSRCGMSIVKWSICRC